MREGVDGVGEAGAVVGGGAGGARGEEGGFVGEG